MRRHTTIALLLVACMTYLVVTATQARAGDIRQVQVGPIHCGPVYCWQRKVVTTHVHGERTIVATYGHHRPVESRSTWTTPAFTDYQLRAVVVMPVQ